MTGKATQNNPAAFGAWGKIKREVRPGSGLPLRARFFLRIARALPDFAFVSTRTLLFRRAGFGIGPDTSILGRTHLIGEGDLTARLTTGKGCIIAPHVTLGLDAAITLGENVSLGPGATLYTATHALGFGSRRMALAVSARPIVVEDGAWIGMQALVLPGVTLGRGCVVSAGSVVTQDVAPNTLVAGNPATLQQALPFGNR